MEKAKKRIDLTGCEYTTITALYEQVAEICGETSGVHFDCTKIEVSENIALAIFEHYENNGVSRDNAGMKWVCYGPKTNDHLPNDTCAIESGFFVRVGEIV